MRGLLHDLQLALASPSRNPRMAVVLGRLLATAFLICFGTGLYSHFLQEPLAWMTFVTRPLWLYQLTQGLHITAGIVCFPLLLGKLHAVYPQLFQTPAVRNFGHILERASIALFVSAASLQIVMGLINTYQWYPWPFSFRRVHFALAIVIIGSLAIHIAVKLPVITRYWTKKRSFDAEGKLLPLEAVEPLPTPVEPEPIPVAAREQAASQAAARGVTGRVLAWIDSAPPRQPKVSRRGFLTTISIAAAGVVALTAGQSFRVLDGINVFAPRKQGLGPNDLPINRTAEAAKVTTLAFDPAWKLTVSRGDVSSSFTLAELSALPQHEVDLPISCVEGWSQMAHWRGVRLKDLADHVGSDGTQSARMTSFEPQGNYRQTTLGAEFVNDELTLIALELNGDKLDVEHGYPARLIAPARPGVLQTKWLSTVEVI